MQQRDRTVEQELARLASAAHGVVTRAQLLAARLTPEEIRQRLEKGSLLRELDRRREREAYARGDDFRRYTYGDVYEQPRPLLAELRKSLVGQR